MHDKKKGQAAVNKNDKLHDYHSYAKQAREPILGVSREAAASVLGTSRLVYLVRVVCK